MERVTFLEVLDRRAQVRQRVRVDTLPLRIGRAYHNDIILDDLYVSPTHAVIERVGSGGAGVSEDVGNDELVLRDLGSENGIRVGARTIRAEAVPISIPCEFRVGRTRCRVRDARHTVAPALREASDLGLGRMLQRPWIAALLFLAVVATTVVTALDGTRRDLDWGHLAEELLTSGLVLALWVGLWALVTRVLTPRTRALAHWIIVSSYTLFEVALAWAGTWLRFFVTAITPVQIFEIALSAAVAVAVFYAHISLTGGLRRAARVGLAALLGVAFVSVNQLETVFRRPDWVQVLPYWSQLQPVDPRWLPTESREAFFDATALLRAPLDRAAERAVASRPDSPEREDEDELRKP